jgi:hypothetical protein
MGVGVKVEAGEIVGVGTEAAVDMLNSVLHPIKSSITKTKPALLAKE